MSDQLPIFEKFLDKAPKTGSFDVVRQAVVILVGSLARHLSPEDPRIQPITMRLIAALSTPSQQVSLMKIQIKSQHSSAVWTNVIFTKCFTID